MSSGYFQHFLHHYLAPHPKREVRELYVSKTILDFATAMVMLYEPIYLHRLGFSIFAILGFFMAVYVLYFFLVPIGARISRAKGFEHTMVYSSPFLILWYLSFFAIALDWRFSFLAIVSLAIQKMLYWPSYHSDFSTWRTRTETGREISNLAALASFSTALAPLAGGMVIAIGGFPALFILVSVLILISNIPMLTTPERPMLERISYRSAIARLVGRKNRRLMLSHLGFGEEQIALVLWPIFIVSFVPDLLSLGAIVSLAVAVRILIVLYVGGLVDDGAQQPVLRNGTVFTAGSWFVRPLVSGPLGVFLFDSFYGVSKNMVVVPMLSMMYDGADDGQETANIVFFQMSLCLGKILACLLAMLIFWLLPSGWWAIFLLAGMFTMLYALMGTRADSSGR